MAKLGYIMLNLARVSYLGLTWLYLAKLRYIWQY